MLTNKSGIRPIGGYVVIELPEAQKTSAGGIILPENEAEKQKYGTTRGTVIAAAEDVRFGLATGQSVAFARYAGTTIKGVDGEDYRLLLDEDVKGIFDSPPALSVAA